MAKNSKKAKELTPEMVEQLGSLGIKDVTTEKDAKKILVEKLGEHEIDDVEDDTLEELCEMYEAFYEPSEEKETAHEEEKEYDEAVKESKKETVKEKKANKKAAEKGGKGKATKKETGKASKKEEKVSTKKVETKKEEKPKAKRKSTRGTAWDKENKEHVTALEKVIAGAMPKGVKYELKLLKTGATVYLLMESGKKAMFAYEKLRIKEEGLVGVFFFQCLKGFEAVDELAGDFAVDGEEITIKSYNPNLMYTSGIKEADLQRLLEHNDISSVMIEKLSTSDKRAAKAKKRLEEKMVDKDSKKAAKKEAPKKEAAKKEEAPEEEAVEEKVKEKKEKKEKKGKKEKKNKKKK